MLFAAVVAQSRSVNMSVKHFVPEQDTAYLDNCWPDCYVWWVAFYSAPQLKSIFSKKMLFCFVFLHLGISTMYVQCKSEFKACIYKEDTLRAHTPENELYSDVGDILCPTVLLLKQKYSCVSIDSEFFNEWEGVHVILRLLNGTLLCKNLIRYKLFVKYSSIFIHLKTCLKGIVNQVLRVRKQNHKKDKSCSSCCECYGK